MKNVAAKTDYYELLGVAEDAGADEIRSAFHAAAREIHPDVSDSPESEDQFRALAEAYSVLSKPASRLLYDRFGYRGRGNRDDALWEVEQGPRGESVHVPIELRAFEAADGATRLVRYEAARRCEACGRHGTTGERDSDCPTCGGSGREVGERLLKVHTPAGLEHGAQLRVSGEGNVGDRGGTPGDLLLDVTVLDAPRDARAVRYAAFALLLAAVALLLGYLLLG